MGGNEDLDKKLTLHCSSGTEGAVRRGQEARGAGRRKALPPQLGSGGEDRGLTAREKAPQ